MSKQSIYNHISRMEAAQSLGYFYEWNEFKKEIDKLQKTIYESNKEKARLRDIIQRKNQTIRITKYKLRVSNETIDK